MGLVLTTLGLYGYLIIARIIVTLLIQASLLNKDKSWVKMFDKVVGVLVDPVTNFMKLYLPFLLLKGLDLSPVLLYVLVDVLSRFLVVA